MYLNNYNVIHINSQSWSVAIFRKPPNLSPSCSTLCYLNMNIISGAYSWAPDNNQLFIVLSKSVISEGNEPRVGYKNVRDRYGSLYQYGFRPYQFDADSG